MAFQSEHNMTINGNVNSALWNALPQAVSLGQNNVNGCTYAVTSKATPETLSYGGAKRACPFLTYGTPGFGAPPPLLPPSLAAPGATAIHQLARAAACRGGFSFA
jgi:hypothetical protein